MKKLYLLIIILVGVLFLSPTLVKAGNEVVSVGAYEEVRNLMSVNNELFFMALDGSIGKYNIYKYNTISKITTPLIRDGVDSNPEGFVVLNGEFYFCSKNRNVNYDLWKSDGTPEGTNIVYNDIVPDNDDERPEFFYPFNNKLFYRGPDNQLWAYDPSKNDAQLIKRINDSEWQPWPANFIAFNNKLYFIADDSSNGVELWRTDGTEAGTVMVKDINPNRDNWWVPESFIINGNYLFFVANNGTNGYELWRTDGTSGGTVMVKDINPLNNNNNQYNEKPSNFVNYNGLLYFSANNGTNGYELWRTDGTSGGTVMVKDINPGSGSSGVSQMYVYNNNIYFSAWTPEYGSELWKSNGTANGTIMLKNINGGSVSSYPSHFLSANNLLYFVANNGSNGSEVWKTDGTANNTTMLQEVIIGFSGFYPEFLTNVNNVLFFTAIESWSSKKIWSYDTTVETTGAGIMGTCYASNYKAKNTSPNQSIYKPSLSQAQLKLYKGKFVKTNNGNVFYVNPRTLVLELVNNDPIYYLSKIAIGMKNRDVDRLSDLSADEATPYSKKFANKVITQVQNRCVLWYVNGDGKKTKIDNPLGLANFLATQL